MTDSTAAGLAPPPEGALAGESVPRENERPAVDEAAIERFMGILKSRGEPWTSMSVSELRERADEYARRQRSERDT